MGFEQIGKAQQNALAIRGTQAAPHTRIERGARVTHRAIDVGGVRVHDRRETFAACRIKHIQPTLRMRAVLRAADKQAEIALHERANRIADDNRCIVTHILCLS